MYSVKYCEQCRKKHDLPKLEPMFKNTCIICLKDKKCHYKFFPKKSFNAELFMKLDEIITPLKLDNEPRKYLICQDSAWCDDKCDCATIHEETYMCNRGIDCPDGWPSKCVKPNLAIVLAHMHRLDFMTDRIEDQTFEIRDKIGKK